MLGRSIAVLTLVLCAAGAHAQDLVLEAEVMEGSGDIALRGLAPNRVGYALVHHKHQADQASFASWLRQHAGAQVAFEAPDGTVHAAVIERLKHCFGRGLLLYMDAVALKEKDVIRLRLGRTN